MWMTDEELEEHDQNMARIRERRQKQYDSLSPLEKIIINLIVLSPLIYIIICGIIGTLKQKGLIAP